MYRTHSQRRQIQSVCVFFLVRLYPCTRRQPGDLVSSRGITQKWRHCCVLTFHLSLLRLSAETESLLWSRCPFVGRVAWSLLPQCAFVLGLRIVVALELAAGSPDPVAPGLRTSLPFRDGASTKASDSEGVLDAIRRVWGTPIESEALLCLADICQMLVLDMLIYAVALFILDRWVRLFYGLQARCVTLYLFLQLSSRCLWLHARAFPFWCVPRLLLPSSALRTPAAPAATCSNALRSAVVRT